MYRMIVAAKIRAAWEQVQARNPAAVVQQFAPSFSYTFVGDHALGGTRTTRAAQLAWFERLFRLFPTIRFTLRDVIVTGPPWNTRAAALLDVEIPGERGYRPEEPTWTNEIVQIVQLRWGRIVSIRTMTDTQREIALLGRLASAGREEALAAPIHDQPEPARSSDRSLDPNAVAASPSR